MTGDGGGPWWAQREHFVILLVLQKTKDGEPVRKDMVRTVATSCCRRRQDRKDPRCFEL